MALVEPEIGAVRRRADNGRAVGRIGDGAVIDLLDADLAEGRHPRDGGLDMRHQPVEILLEELVFAVGVRPVEIAAGRADLVGTEQQAAILLAHVPGGVALPEHPHFRQALAAALDDRRMRFGDDVLVLDRDHRHVQPDHAPRPPGEITGGRDDVVADDLALVGDDLPLAGGQLLDGADGGVAVDGGAAVASAAGQRLGQVGGLNIAVLGMLDRAENAVGLAERPDLLQLCGRQQPDRHTDRLGDAGIVHVLVPAVPGARQPDIGDVREADIHAGFFLQLAIEAHGIAVQLADGIAHVEQRQQAGGVPGGAGSQFATLDQDAVGPALAGQMIERRHADHAAADDHCPRPILHDHPSSARLP